MLDLFNVLDTTMCGGVIGTEIPGTLQNIVHYVYLGIQVVVPILLIVFGMIELAKAITAQKEDEIKKAQSSFLKKLVIAVLVFLVFTVVQLVFNFATGDLEENDKDNVWGCMCELVKGSTKKCTKK